MSALHVYVRWAALGTNCTDLVPFRVIAMRSHTVELDMWIKHDPYAVVSFMEAVQGPLNAVGIVVPFEQARDRLLDRLSPRLTLGGYNLPPIIKAFNLQKGVDFLDTWDARETCTIFNPIKAMMGDTHAVTRFTLEHLARQLTPHAKLVLTDDVSRVKAIDEIYRCHRTSTTSTLLKLLTAVRPRATGASRCGATCDGVCMALLSHTPCVCQVVSN
jgi:hypothetical protein